MMVQARQLGIALPFIGGNGMNSPRVFDLAKDNSDNLWVGSPWSVENPAAENKRFIAAYQKAHNALPDQFAAQAYDAMYIVAQALKKIKLTGKLEADRNALRDALPAVQMDRRHRPLQVSPGQRQATASRPVTTPSRPPS